jgi:hypothetical protein
MVDDQEESTLTRLLIGADDSESWCFTHMGMVDKGQVIASAISQGVAIAVSNGSFKDTFGTVA